MLDGTRKEQQAIQTIAEYIESRRASPGAVESLLAELSEPRFSTPDEGLSPARQAARKFMRENPALMRRLAQ